MAIRGEWAEPCKGCGAVGSCCETAKARLETANQLSTLTARQSRRITALEIELHEKKQVIEDLRAKASPRVGI